MSIFPLIAATQTADLTPGVIGALMVVAGWGFQPPAKPDAKLTFWNDHDQFPRYVRIPIGILALLLAAYPLCANLASRM